MRIRLLQSTVFRDRTSVAEVQPEFRAAASTDTQIVPDWVTKDPYFQMLEEDGKIEVVTSPVAKRIASANPANVGLAGIEPTTDLTTDQLAAREDAFNKAQAAAASDGDSAADAKAKVADAKAKADADAASKGKSDGK